MLRVLKENEIYISNAVINRPVDLDKTLYWYKKAVGAVADMVIKICWQIYTEKLAT